MAASIFNSKGARVAVVVVVGSEIYDLAGKKLYDLRGQNIYPPTGELVGHLNDVRGSDKHLARSTDRLFLVLSRDAERSSKQRWDRLSFVAGSFHLSEQLMIQVRSIMKEHHPR